MSKSITFNYENTEGDVFKNEIVLNSRHQFVVFYFRPALGESSIRCNASHTLFPNDIKKRTMKTDVFDVSMSFGKEFRNRGWGFSGEIPITGFYDTARLKNCLSDGDTRLGKCIIPRIFNGSINSTGIDDQIFSGDPQEHTLSESTLDSMFKLLKREKNNIKKITIRHLGVLIHLPTKVYFYTVLYGNDIKLPIQRWKISHQRDMPILDLKNMLICSCGNEYNPGDVKNVHKSLRHFCERCRNGLVPCKTCGHYMHIDNLCNDECAVCTQKTDKRKRCYCGRTHTFTRILCDTCDEHYGSNTVRDYHNFNYNRYTNAFGLNKKAKYNELTFGLELEYECNHELYDMECLYNSDYWHFERDGSLDNGFELITQPFTYKFYTDELKKVLGDYLRSIGDDVFTADDTGLHIHVRNCFSTTTLDNISFLVEKFKKEISIIARREANSYCEYKHPYSPSINKDNVKYTDYKHKYSAVHMKGKTVEFRMFKSTLSMKELNACIQLVKNICLIANKRNKDISDVTFEDVVSLPNSKELKTLYNENMKGEI